MDIQTRRRFLGAVAAISGSSLAGCATSEDPRRNNDDTEHRDSSVDELKEEYGEQLAPYGFHVEKIDLQIVRLYSPVITERESVTIEYTEEEKREGTNNRTVTKTFQSHVDIGLHIERQAEYEESVDSDESGLPPDAPVNGNSEIVDDFESSRTFRKREGDSPEDYVIETPRYDGLYVSENLWEYAEDLRFSLDYSESENGVEYYTYTVDEDDVGEDAYINNLDIIEELDCEWVVTEDGDFEYIKVYAESPDGEFISREWEFSGIDSTTFEIPEWYKDEI